MITLVPIGGLCNRMRSTATAYALSRRLKTTLKVIWIVNNDLGAAYNELLNTLFGINICVINNIIKNKATIISVLWVVALYIVSDRSDASATRI
jgi:hypothetical protein